MSLEPFPWFKFYQREFYNSNAVRMMSAEGEALYLRLLSEQWDAGEAISSSRALWERVHGGKYRDFKAAWKDVVKSFEVDGALMINERLELERSGASDRKERRSRSATHAARMRWACGSDAKTEREREIKSKKKTQKKSAGARKAFYERPPFGEYFDFGFVDMLQLAWEGFIGTKKRRAAGPLTEAAVRRHLVKLAKLGPDDASRCLNYSEEGNYPGLFPDRYTGSGSPSANGRARQDRPNFAEYFAGLEPKTIDADPEPTRDKP